MYYMLLYSIIDGVVKNHERARNIFLSCDFDFSQLKKISNSKNDDANGTRLKSVTVPPL